MVREPADVWRLRRTVGSRNPGLEVRSRKGAGTSAAGRSQKIVDRGDCKTRYVLGQNCCAHHKDPRGSTAQRRCLTEPREHGENRQKATVFARHRFFNRVVHEGVAKERTLGVRTSAVERTVQSGRFKTTQTLAQFLVV